MCLGKYNTRKRAPISSLNLHNISDLSMIKSQFSPVKKNQNFTKFGDKKKANPIDQFSKINKVRMAIKKFREQSRFRRTNSLKTFHYELISDNCYYQAKHKKKFSIQGNEHNDKKILRIIKNEILSSFKKKYKAFCQKICFKFPKIKINSQFKLIWNIWMFVIIISEFFFSTIQLCFEINQEFNEAVRIPFSIQFVFFTLNSFISINSNFYESGVAVVDKKKKISNYVRTFFFNDLLVLISIFPLEAIYQIKILRILFLFVYKTVKRIIENIREFFEESCKEDIFDFWYLLLKMVLIAHILACIWHVLGYYLINFVEFSWLSIDGKYEKDWISRYIMSIYWAFTTMSTVGYGDITPQNNGERVFCMIAMMIGAILFGYLVNTVGGILNRMEEKSRESVQNMKIADNFMRRKNIDNSLRVKVKKYLEYLWQNEYKSLEKEEEIFGKLPASLRNEILLESNLKYLKEIPILSKNFSPELIEYLALTIKPVQYSPDEIILDSTKNQEPSLYLISEGEIEIYIKKHTKKHSVKNLKKGGVFGERSFFFNSINDENAQAKTFSTVYKISRKEFFEFLATHHKDYEKYCEIRDMCIFSKNYENLIIKCNSCANQDHFIEQCPKLTYYPNKHLIIDRLNYSKPQFRNIALRKSRKQNAFLSKKNATKNAMHVRFNKSLMNHFKEYNNNLKNIENDKNSNKSIEIQNISQKKNKENDLKEINDDSLFFRSKSLPTIRSAIHEPLKEKKIKSLCDFGDLNSKIPINRIFDLEKNEITKMYQSSFEEDMRQERLKHQEKVHFKMEFEEEKEKSQENASLLNLNYKNESDQDNSLVSSKMEFSPLNMNKKINEISNENIRKESCESNTENIEEKTNLHKNLQNVKFNDNSRSVSWRNLKIPSLKKQSNTNLCNSPELPIMMKQTSKKITQKFHNTIGTKTTRSIKSSLKLESDNILKNKWLDRKKKELFLFDFEIMKEFENYFKECNLGNILNANNWMSNATSKKTS